MSGKENVISGKKVLSTQGSMVCSRKHLSSVSSLESSAFSWNSALHVSCNFIHDHILVRNCVEISIQIMHSNHTDAYKIWLTEMYVNITWYVMTIIHYRTGVISNANHTYRYSHGSEFIGRQQDKNNSEIYVNHVCMFEAKKCSKSWMLLNGNIHAQNW